MFAQRIKIPVSTDLNKNLFKTVEILFYNFVVHVPWNKLKTQWNLHFSPNSTHQNEPPTTQARGFGQTETEKQLFWMKNKVIYLAPVVRKVESAIHWINYYAKDSAIGFRNMYLSSGEQFIQLLNNQGLMDSAKSRQTADVLSF